MSEVLKEYFQKMYEEAKREIAQLKAENAKLVKILESYGKEHLANMHLIKKRKGK
jgi:hypothetical protein